jgi:putative ABC transport system ATP-binding protein
MIRLQGLTKIYPEGNSQHMVLQDVDGEIAQGEIVAVLGRSGSGKSTLLNLISGIDVPTSGQILVNSTPIHSLSEEDRTLFRRRNMGFVFQFFNLIPTLTVAENVLLPLELAGRVGREEQTRARDLLEMVELEDRANSYPDRLSGGEQQRVAVTRALIHEPLLVLADEPTGNLDADTGAQVLRLLEDLTRRAGKTLVVGTHSREVVAIADRVWTIRKARVEEIAKEKAR